MSILELLGRHAPDIIFSVAMVCVFIGVFFFTYGAYLEKRILLRQMHIIVNDFANDIHVLSPSSMPQLRAFFATLRAPSSGNADSKVAEANRKLVKKAAIVLSILFCVGSAISAAILISRKEPILPFVKLNLLVFMFVAITYTLFSTFIIGNYQYADTNRVKRDILDAL